MKKAAASLVEDFDLYPRTRISTVNVSQLVDAIRAGATLPPIVVDDKDRIIDGYHRRRAYLSVYGDTAEIECDVRHYDSDAEAFIDAMRLNAGHGRNLTTHERVRCALRSDELGIEPERVAVALAISERKLADLTVSRTARSRDGIVPLKRTIRFKAGDKLTKRQVAANRRLSGMSAAFYVNQVIELVEANLVDRSNPVICERLDALASLLVAVGPFVEEATA